MAFFSIAIQKADENLFPVPDKSSGQLKAVVFIYPDLRQEIFGVCRKFCILFPGLVDQGIIPVGSLRGKYSKIYGTPGYTELELIRSDGREGRSQGADRRQRRQGV